MAKFYTLYLQPLEQVMLLTRLYFISGSAQTPPKGGEQQCSCSYPVRFPRTFLARRVLGVQVAADRHHLDEEAVPSLPDHVDHLPVAHLHHVLLVHLQGAASVTLSWSGRSSGSTARPRSRY